MASASSEEVALPARPRLPAAVLALGFASLLNDVGSEMIFPLLPLFLTQTLGAGPAFLGLVEGAADALASLLKLASGAVSDRLARRKPLVVLGYGVAGLVRPLVAVAAAPWHVLAVRLADRFGKGMRSAPRDALIADSVPRDEAGRAFGFHRAMDHAGALVGPLVAMALLSAGLELRTVFWLALAPGLLAAMAVLLAPERMRAPASRAPAPAARPAHGPMPARFRTYLLVLALFSLGNSSDAFLLLRANELGVPTAMLPLLWAALHVAKMLSATVFGRLSDRLPRVRLVIAGWGVYALGYLGFATATGPWQACAWFVFYGVWYGLAEPAEKALVRDLVPEGRRGAGFGWYNFVLGAAALPAGLLAGGLWRAFGPAAALGTGAALAGASALLLAAWSRAGAPVRPRG